MFKEILKLKLVENRAIEMAQWEKMLTTKSDT